jgi:hypothetical protein
MLDRLREEWDDARLYEMPYVPPTSESEPADVILT